MCNCKCRDDGKKRPKIFCHNDEGQKEKQMIVAFKNVEKTDPEKCLELLVHSSGFYKKGWLRRRKDMILFFAECLYKKNIHLIVIFLEEYPLIDNESGHLDF